MRRKEGTGLVRNEKVVLAAALRLANEGKPGVYGYQLLAILRDWNEKKLPMDHGTVYRCLRSLEKRGLFTSRLELVGGIEGREGNRPRYWFDFTPDGVTAARKATIQLAAEDEPPAWVNPADAIRFGRSIQGGGS